jgi:hypothetical protein
MFLRCHCGYTMTDVATPGRIVHLLLSEHAIERLQNAVDHEAEQAGVIEGWPEHWEAARAIEAWLCPRCSRLYVGMGGRGPVRVFTLECIGIAPAVTGLDSELGSEADLLRLASEQAGESPLSAPGAEPLDGL